MFSLILEYININHFTLKQFYQYKLWNKSDSNKKKQERIRISLVVDRKSVNQYILSTSHKISWLLWKHNVTQSRFSAFRIRIHIHTSILQIYGNDNPSSRTDCQHKVHPIPRAYVSRVPPQHPLPPLRPCDPLTPSERIFVRVRR